MTFNAERSWMEPEFGDSANRNLKRLRHDHCNNSDTSDGGPWKLPASEPAVTYDYGDSFGYEVYMLKIAADELAEPSSPSSDDEPLGVDELQIEKELSRLGEHDGSTSGDDRMMSRLEIDVVRESHLKANNQGIASYSGKSVKVERSDSDSDSDGYESDFSYFTVSPVSVAPVVGRTVQVLVVDDSVIQRKISRCLLSGKVHSTTQLVTLLALYQTQTTFWLKDSTATGS